MWQGGIFGKTRDGFCLCKMGGFLSLKEWAFDLLHPSSPSVQLNSEHKKHLVLAVTHGVSSARPRHMLLPWL